MAAGIVKKGGWVWKGSAIFLLLFCGLMLFLDLNSKSALERAHARLKAAGFPLSLSDFRAQYPLPSQKAGETSKAPWWAHLPGNPLPDHFDLGSFERQMSDEEWDEVSQKEPIIDKYVELSKKLEPSKISELLSVSHGERISITEDGKAMRKLTDALLSKAMLEYHRSNRLAALKMVKAALLSSQFLIDSPNIYFNFINTNEKNCLRILKVILASGNLSKEETGVVSEMKSGMREARPLSFYIMFQRYRGISYYSAYRQVPLTLFPRSIPWQKTVFLGLINTPAGRYGEVNLLNSIADSVEGESKPGATLLDLYHTQKSVETRFNSPAQLDFASHFNAGIYASASYTVLAMMEHQAHKDLLAAAVGGETGNDPFTSKPYLKIRKSGIEYVYSVGRDFSDDKGDRETDLSLPVISSLSKQTH